MIGVTCKTPGCRNPDCVRDKKRYRAEYERAIARGHEFTVSTERLRRKVGALRRLGWSIGQIAERMGSCHQNLSAVLRRDRVRATTAGRIDEVYRELEMEIPPATRWTTLVRNQAEAEGHKPPLAWEDIDAGILGIDSVFGIDQTHVDEWNVEQALQYHDFSVQLTVAEKVEIVRRWKAAGRSEASLCRLTGWKEGRYKSPTSQEAS